MRTAFASLHSSYCILWGRAGFWPTRTFIEWRNMSTELTTTDETLQPDQAGLQAYLGHVQKRRCIRKLTSGPVTDEVIRSILEAGRWSPSSNNSQPARLVVVKERQAEFWDFVANALQQKLQGEQLE